TRAHINGVLLAGGPAAPRPARVNGGMPAHPEDLAATGTSFFAHTTQRSRTGGGRGTPPPRPPGRAPRPAPTNAAPARPHPPPRPARRTSPPERPQLVQQHHSGRTKAAPLPDPRAEEILQQEFLGSPPAGPATRPQQRNSEPRNDAAKQAARPPQINDHSRRA